MASSIEQAKELKALLEEQSKLMSQQTEMLKTQMGIMRQMSDAIRQMNIEGLGRGIEELSGAVKNAATAVDQLGGSAKVMQDLKSASRDNIDNLDELGKSAEQFGRKMLKLAPIVGTIEGMAGGFKLTMNAMSSLLSVSTGLISSLTNMAASIIALPFKMLYGLMNQTSGGGSGLRQEFENVRKTFGDLASNEGKAVIDSWRGISHFGGELAETGLSVWRTMGNMAESMARLREIAEQMGPLFHNFQRQLAEGGERIFAYQKGLHLTEEGLRAMTETAQRTGETFQEVGRHVTSTAFAMGEAFGMNGALISQDIGNMMDDFEHFGSLGVQELAQVSVYARKLGVEIEKLTGALDQFADFDKAAESVAQLSQAFGLQLDTLELVQEQDPAANIERLRKAFFAAGRSIETMTRQERALLATQTGLDEKTASLVFSQENQALSYADIQKQGENAEKQQLSQAEAMQKLAGSIERLVKSGGALQGGFIDIFLQGFLKGIRRTKEFWNLMRNLRRAMRSTFMAGRQVGQLFVKNFPGVRDVLKGIGELFDPRRFRKMLGGVVHAFRDFFQDMTRNPDVALPRLLERLKESFTNWFDASTPSGRRILDGFKTFVKALTTIFAGLLKQAIKGLTEVFKGITSFISGDPAGALSGAAQGATSGIMGFLMEVFEPLITFFRSAEGQRMLTQLWSSFTEMLGTAWEFVKPHIISFIEENWPIVLAALFGPTVIGGLVRGLGTALTGGLVKAVAGGLTGFVREGPGLVRNAFRSLDNLTKRGSVAGGGRQAKSLTGAIEGAGQAVQASRRARVSAGDIAKMVTLAAVITVGLIAIAIAMTELADHIQKAGITRENIVNAAIVMLATGGVMLELSGVIAILAAAGQALQSFGPQVIAGLLAVGAIGAAMAVGAGLMVDAFKDYTESDINNTVRIMGATSLFFLAAAAVTGIAALVGSAIVGSYGIGALVILAGLATLGTVIFAMVETTKEIIKRVNAIHLNAGIQQKMDVFAQVLEAVGGFAAHIGEIATAASPGIVDLIRGGDTMTDRLDGVSNLVRTMGTTLIGVVQEIVTQAQRLEGMDESASRKAEFLATMLSTIGSVAENLRPPDSLMNVSLFEALQGETVSERLQQLATYITRIFTEIRATLVTIITQFSSLAQSSGLTEQAVAAAQAISAIMNSVALLARAMTIFIAEQFGSDPERLRQAAPLISSVVDNLLGAVVGTGGQNIFSRIAGVLRTVLNGVGELRPAQLRALKTATPVIESMFTVMASIAALVGNVGLGNAIQASPEQTQRQIDQLVRVVNAITYGIGNNVRNLITTLVDSFSGLNRGQAASVKTGVDALKQTFEALGSLIEATQGLSELGGEGQSIEMAQLRIQTALSAITTLLFNQGGESLSAFLEGLPPIMTILNAAGSAVAAQMPAFLETMNTTKSFFNSFNQFFNSEAFQNVSTIEEAAITRTKDAVVAMIDRIGDIDIALERLRVVNLNTRLQELNHKLGLRSTGRLDIREEPIQFHVNFTVRIDAAELETVLIDRPNSRIAARGE